MDGVLVIDKPAGMTSHDVVAAVRKRLGTKKVGHAGTLDPDATGLLVVGVGRATRFLSFAEAAPKRYVAVARFGITTSTQDASGEVVEELPANLSRSEVEAALEHFRGTIAQIPPMVSAVKVGGERLYKKARRGEEVERAAREVSIFSLQLVDFAAATAESPPEATFEVECSKGTYVRTLVHDLGQKIGCGAHLANLRRTAVGGFTEAAAVPLDDAGPGDLLPLLSLLGGVAKVEIDDAARALVSNGRALAAPDALSEGEKVALVHGGELVAVYERKGELLTADRVVGS